MQAIYTTPNPAGFDLKLLEVQTQLASLNFMEAVFGQAHIQCELKLDSITEDKVFLPDLGKKGTLKHERWYPQGTKLGGNVDLTFSDSYASRIFFLAKDPISTSPTQDKWDWTSPNPEIKQPFSLILHCNIDKLNKLNLSVFDNEKVKLSILYALSQCPKIIVNSMSENIDNVWKEFSMSSEINGFDQPPFYALRVEADAYYYAFAMNGGVAYDPSINYSPETTQQPNQDAGYANVN